MQILNKNEQATVTRFNWDDLHFFLALAREGQLSKAARQLRSSHITVSRRIDRLEAALHQRLFERNPRGYELTTAGRRMIEAAERMEAAAAEVPQDQVHVSGQGGNLRLAVPEGFGSLFSECVLPEFVACFPLMSLELITMTQVLSLSRREADLTVTLDPVSNGPYRSERLSPYTLGVYGKAEYLASHPPIHNRDDLLAHRFIGYIEEMLFASGLDYLGEVHPALRPTLKSSSIFNQRAATLNGLGLCVMPIYMSAGLVRVLPDQVRLSRCYWLTCHRDLRQQQRIRRVIEFLKDAITARASLLEPDLYSGPGDAHHLRRIRTTRDTAPDPLTSD